jgi:trimethylamine--corrinoid protein Co-methyltransferase
LGIKISRTMEFLKRDELESIHSASLHVLSTTGLRISSEHVLKTLREMGASIDFEKQIATFPESFVRDMLKKCPAKIRLCGRNSKYDCVLGEDKAYATTTGGALYVWDSRKKRFRKAVEKDVADLSRLADALPYVDVNEGLVDPQEIPHTVRDVHAAALIFKNTEKHSRYCPGSLEGAKAFIKMAATIVGGEEELRKRPILSGAGYATPPLQYDERGITMFQEFIRAGITTYVGSEPISGGIDPVTLAGTLVQNNAEALGGIVIAQSIQPGAPVVYGGHCNTIDMKTGVAAMASPENALMGAVIPQLARYYGLPSWMYSGISNSKVPDAQSAYEKTATALMPLLTGANLHYANGNAGAAIVTSYEQLVIDDEILEMLARILRGFEVTDETLAVDVICKVGPGGNYLAQPHTLKHFATEHLSPTLSDRLSLDAWIRAGSKDTAQRARERAEHLLKTHYPEPLDRDVDKKIDEIVKQSDKTLLKRHAR